MRFEKIELCNWDMQANQTIVLQPGVNLLTGENGSGKTSILDAIKVALGATRLGADRSVDSYLRKREAPWAMVRLVADNRADPDTRRRPFHPLGPYEQDLVTLAVVFEAGDEGYDRRTYLVDGDRSPLTPGFDGKPFTRQRDYRDRLARLGMGASFRKLLCTPQGRIASLCDNAPGALFDLLFDFIGGKEVLDEWLELRARFERQERGRQERAGVLAERERELTHLGKRLESHQRFRRHLEQVHLVEAALPISRAARAEEQLRELQGERDHHREALRQAREDGHSQHAAVQRLGEAQRELRRRSASLEDERKAVRERETALFEEQVTLRAEHGQLETLRTKAEDLAILDLDQLLDQRERAEAKGADLRHQRRQILERQERIDGELSQLERGLLTPPEGVEAFREALALAEVPHQLLMSLVEPLDEAPEARQALESYLGDLRFAVAVPDKESFRRAVALAREHRFPYTMLAPDIRSPSPRKGEHPFLDAVRVIDPRYQGLINRVLRHVRWLASPIEDTHRAPGARVDAQGFVLDRQGARYRGAERHYLGRAALERRRAELRAERDQVEVERATIEAELDRTEVRLRLLARSIEKEHLRLRWLEHAERHAHLAVLLERSAATLVEIRGRQQSLEDQNASIQSELQTSERELGRCENRQRDARVRARRAEAALEDLAPRIEQAGACLIELRDALPEAEEIPAEVLAHATGDPSHLEAELRQEQRWVEDFDEADRNPDLPGNYRTLERQVRAVGAELERLQQQVSEARDAAERAHEQYKTVTRRVFRRYFALLSQAGEPLGFTTQGQLRPRDDGRFDLRLDLAVGDKEPVPYSSPSLSGGQRAALSILMAMTTLQVGEVRDGAGFFLVDEPFSASDAHKIQELGTFLDRTGAQYLVSMPTSADIRRAGSWLQGVLTCTLTRGGYDSRGELRLAPPVRCSYVVRDGA